VSFLRGKRERERKRLSSVCGCVDSTLTYPNSMLLNYENLLIEVGLVGCVGDQVIVNVTAAPMVLTETDVAELCTTGRR
jgi:hypothetical protein